MKDREVRLYAKVLSAGVGRAVDCRPNEWRVAQALVCQGLIELAGERSPHGYFKVCAKAWNIPPAANANVLCGREP